ncbi:MAG: 7-cyano-7-deazaguanine synthase, partial [archaeon]
MDNSKKVVVGLSGGVDSSMALVILKEQGYTPIAVSLKLPRWNKDKSACENSCCTKESLDIARNICKKLDVEYHIVDATKEFKKEVVDYFIKELKNNRTPNPCTICNARHKFKHLFAFAKKHKINYVATGHYAKVKYNKKTKKYELLRPKDKSKDQTYGLCLLSQEWLSKIIFPLASYTKDEIY